MRICTSHEICFYTCESQPPNKFHSHGPITVEQSKLGTWMYLSVLKGKTSSRDVKKSCWRTSKSGTGHPDRVEGVAFILFQNRRDIFFQCKGWIMTVAACGHHQRRHLHLFRGNIMVYSHIKSMPRSSQTLYNVHSHILGKPISKTLPN